MAARDYVLAVMLTRALLKIQVRLGHDAGQMQYLKYISRPAPQLSVNKAFEKLHTTASLGFDRQLPTFGPPVHVQELFKSCSGGAVQEYPFKSICSGFAVQELFSPLPYSRAQKCGCRRPTDCQIQTSLSPNLESRPYSCLEGGGDVAPMIPKAVLIAGDSHSTIRLPRHYLANGRYKTYLMLRLRFSFSCECFREYGEPGWPPKLTVPCHPEARRFEHLLLSPPPLFNIRLLSLVAQVPLCFLFRTSHRLAMETVWVALWILSFCTTISRLMVIGRFQGGWSEMRKTWVRTLIKEI
ncbi:hypothetical protein BDP55DRAFT_230644 [Colletotrichum godetiae]|uniref:Uncharacterized protein n=1 Tax=Colletotrichum godetiae TaxID=1209918 RepID=A0AAJ0AGX6_9PEZI|nr:uncharacterized protein BDP55DRAFT_230644 [Colletotrichum godetiae]KAK1673049.1 hypothetical protein BDP55DRAFT_230644 [Colletotrichum godetiae]